jgi:hypothetical protein
MSKEGRHAAIDAQNVIAGQSGGLGDIPQHLAKRYQEQNAKLVEALTRIKLRLDESHFNWDEAILIMNNAETIAEEALKELDQ